jgi:hypothetical protein
MPAMALQPLSPLELAGSRTLFASFMGAAGERYRTVAELLAIYRDRSRALSARNDRGDHMRVERFRRDMAGERWDADVVMRVGEFDDDVLVIDGIHRGIAYLACIQDGISPARLPALHVSR